MFNKGGCIAEKSVICPPFFIGVGEEGYNTFKGVILEVSIYPDFENTMRIYIYREWWRYYNR